MGCILHYYQSKKKMPNEEPSGEINNNYCLLKNMNESLKQYSSELALFD